MKIETTNVVEVLDNKVLQIIAFTGPDAEKEAQEMFKTLVLEHNDPDNDPPMDVLSFGEEELELMAQDCLYDDDNGYVLSIVKSSPPTKKDLEEAKLKLTPK